MNKKPGLLFAIALFAIIILATSFHMDFGGNPPLELRSGVNPENVLYVCPVTSSVWETLSQSLHYLDRYASVFFAFIGIVLTFSWGWAIYQNLLKDKFSEDAYKNPWALTKTFFWLIIIFTILIATPNRFRTVGIRDNHGKVDYSWVLCDNTSEGAQAVSYKRVVSR